MSPRELNKGIKKLNADIKKMRDNDGYYKYVENTAKPEFMRLYRADDKFDCVNRRNILIMFRLNQRHRFAPFHNFGINIEL